MRFLLDSANYLTGGIDDIYILLYSIYIIIHYYLYLVPPGVKYANIIARDKCAVSLDIWRNC